MATILIPPLAFGATESSNSSLLATYSERNPFGVEVPAATPADLRGPTEHLRSLRSVGTWADVEHTLSGVHDTLQIPRLFLACAWNTATYGILNESYSAGTYQADAAVFSSVAAGAAGEITVTLGASYALPSATVYRAHSLVGSYTNSSGVVMRTSVNLRTITSATVFVLRRREATTVGGLTLAHGNFSIAVYSEA